MGSHHVLLNKQKIFIGVILMCHVLSPTQLSMPDLLFIPIFFIFRKHNQHTERANLLPALRRQRKLLLCHIMRISSNLIPVRYFISVTSQLSRTHRLKCVHGWTGCYMRRAGVDLWFCNLFFLWAFCGCIDVAEGQPHVYITCNEIRAVWRPHYRPPLIL